MSSKTRTLAGTEHQELIGSGEQACPRQRGCWTWDGCGSTLRTDKADGESVVPAGTCYRQNPGTRDRVTVISWPLKGLMDPPWGLRAQEQAGLGCKIPRDLE